MTLKNIFDRICRLDKKAQALSANFRYDPLMGFMAPLCPDPGSSGQAGYYDDQGCRQTFSYGNRLTANLPDIPGKPRRVRTSVYYKGKDYFLRDHGVVPLPDLTIRERR